MGEGRPHRGGTGTETEGDTNLSTDARQAPGLRHNAQSTRRGLIETFGGWPSGTPDVETAPTNPEGDHGDKTVTGPGLLRHARNTDRTNGRIFRRLAAPASVRRHILIPVSTWRS